MSSPKKPDTTKDDGLVSDCETRSPQEVKEYWTPERIDAARSAMPLVPVAKSKAGQDKDQSDDD